MPSPRTESVFTKGPAQTESEARKIRHETYDFIIRIGGQNMTEGQPNRLKVFDLMERYAAVKNENLKRQVKQQEQRIQKLSQQKHPARS